MTRMAARWVVALAVLATGAAAYGARLVDDDKKIREISEPVLDNILAAAARDDYAGYVRDFDSTAREVLTREAFAAANQQTKSLLGDFKTRTYLGYCHKGEMTVVLWKAVFSKTSDDVLVKLVLSQREGRVFVTGLWFQ